MLRATLATSPFIFLDQPLPLLTPRFPLLWGQDSLFTFRHFIFWTNLLLFTANIAVFFKILRHDIGSENFWLKMFDIAGLTAQFGSQFCAILSCFIFSKIPYAISSKCLDMTWVNEAGVNGTHFWMAWWTLVSTTSHITAALSHHILKFIPVH